MKKCLQCEASMTSKLETVEYDSLPGTMLMGVPVNRCTRCDEYEVGIPAIDELDRVLADEVIGKNGRLNGGEIRFLRSFLELSGVELAKIIGSDPATISRWETDKQAIGHHTDLLLRAMVLLEMKVDTYPIARFAEISGEKGEASRYSVKRSASKWKPAQLAS
jgi:putative zinc finger/helix-turn-helix YgiT family protein